MLWQNIKKHMLEHSTQTIGDFQTTLTFSKAITQAEKIGKDLSGFHKCGVFCCSELQSAIAILGCMSVGITAVPLSIRYGTLHCQKIVQAVDVTCLIVDDASYVENIAGYCGAIYQIGKGFIKMINPNNSDKDCEDCACLMCTSGTSGIPKGVMITENNLWTNLQDIAAYFDIWEDDRILIVRPLYHCAVLTGEFLISLIKGCSIIFNNLPFNPVQILHEVQNYSITVLCGTPTLFYHLSNLCMRQNKPITIRTVAVSGECMTTVVAQRMRTALGNARIYNVYGLTEASPRVSYLPPEQFDEHPLSVGYPLNSLMAKVVNKKGESVPFGTDGELLIKGESIMKGYYRNQNNTRKVLNDGWLHTGDLACIDEDGRISIKTRIDNLIIRAGMNIYPQEIENTLKADARILDAMAYGISHHDVGQRIGIKVVTKQLTYDQLFKLCRKRLPLYQQPDRLDIVESIPKNASGKIVRRQITENNYLMKTKK